MADAFHTGKVVDKRGGTFSQADFIVQFNTARRDALAFENAGFRLFLDH